MNFGVSSNFLNFENLANNCQTTDSIMFKIASLGFEDLFCYRFGDH